MEDSDQDFGSTRNLLPRQLDFSVSAAAVDAKMDSFRVNTQSHSVLDLQSSQENDRGEDLPLPQPQPSDAEKQLRLEVKLLKPPPCSPVMSLKASATEASIQDITPPQKPPLHRFSHQLQKNPLGKCRVSKQDPLTPRGQTEVESKDGTPIKQRHCKCQYSRCLKLYCECFASGYYCNGCNCLNCHNNEASRQEVIMANLERNPDAFKPKIAGGPHGMKDLQEDARQFLNLGKHSKGCHCKKSRCLKKYCECYQENILCSDSCRCQDCKNFEGSDERNSILHGPQVSETYIPQTTNAAVNRAIDMSGYLNPPESIKRKTKEGSHIVPVRGSSAVSHAVQNLGVNNVIMNGKTFLFSPPNNRAVFGSTTPTYRSSLSNTIQPHHVRELCLLLVSKSVDVANKLSCAKCEMDEKRKYDKDPSLDLSQRDGYEINDSPDRVLDASRIPEKPLSPATCALMCDEEHMIISEKETSAQVKASQEKEDADTTSDTYLEQEKQILSSFRDYLIQLLNRGSIINGSNIKTNTNLSRRKWEDEEEQRHRDSMLRKFL